MRMAAEHGMNMILTPVFTPALDTEIGKERPCTQLVEITKNDAGYHFDFARLARWVETAKDCGISKFEISHFFTQWGAKCAPNIYVTENGERNSVGILRQPTRNTRHYCMRCCRSCLHSLKK